MHQAQLAASSPMVAANKCRNASGRPVSGICWLIVGLLGLHTVQQAAEATPQAGSPASWMSQIGALSGQPPKLNSAPLIQLDTSNRYYKTVVDGMMLNFKRAVNKASERTFTLGNLTSSMPISVIGNVGSAGQQQQIKVSILDARIDGINNPKVSNVYVNKKNVKLHVVFNFKTVRVTGRCSLGSTTTKQTSATAIAAASSQQNNALMEATNWNTSWSASIMPMIGRDHFDMKRVYTSHAQQRLSLNLKGCPQQIHDKLKAALMERVKSAIDSRLLEIMETVIIHTDSLTGSDETVASIAANDNNNQPSIPAASLLPRGRGKRASKPSLASSVKQSSTQKKANPILANSRASPKSKSSSSNPGADAPRGSSATKSQATQRPHSSKKVSSKKALKRTKRQTPCQPGEELDDYVDQLFRFGTRIVRAMEPISLPNATIELPDYNLKIFLYEGKGTRAYKFRRTKPAWVFCSNETISLGVTIEVEEMRVAYKYRVISGTRLIFDGDLEARLSPKAQAQFSQAVQEEDSEEPVQQRIDRVRLFRLGRVHVLIRGLGNLTQSLSMIINGYLNDNQEELQPTFRMLEGDALRLLNRFVANLNVPLLSVVARRA